MRERGDGIPQGRIRRTAPIAGAVARTAGVTMVTALRRKVTGADVHIDYEKTAERYAQLLGRSRGALMKAGQALSFVTLGAASSPEMQAALQQALGRLREDAPPMAPELALATLAEALGRPVAEVYAEFEPEPVAAASIGQVHRARLHDGREVAVKVQYPGAADAITADLANFQLLSTFVGLLMGLSPVRIGVDHRQIAREISQHIREELDYRIEAGHQREFAALYAGHPFIHIPAVIDEASGERVLTQEWVGGLGWDEALVAPPEVRSKWVEALARFGQGSMSRFHVGHLDPHPGNFRFHPDGSITVLDFGCVIHLSAAGVLMATQLMQQALRGDVDEVYRLCLEAGMWKASDPVTKEEVFQYWRMNLEPYWGEQPYRITHEKLAEMIAFRLDPTGPCGNLLKHISAPEDVSILQRLDYGILALTAALDVPAHHGAITSEFYERAEPVTEFGRLNAAWIAEHPTAVAYA